MSVQYPYRAVICGEEHIVKGWRGRKLVTDKGGFWARQIPSDRQIQSVRLFEIALIQSDGKNGWLVNGKPLALLETLRMGERLAEISGDEGLRVHKKSVCAVAWAKTNDYGQDTTLLDDIREFWNEASLSVLPVKTIRETAETESPLSELRELSRKSNDALAGLSSALRQIRLSNIWSKPIWLTEFRHAAQKILVSPQQKQLASSDLARHTVEAVEPIKQIAAKADQPKANSKANDVVAPPAKPAPDTFTNIQAAAKYIGVTTKTIRNWKKRGWLKVEQNGRLIRIAKTDLDKCKSKQ